MTEFAITPNDARVGPSVLSNGQTTVSVDFPFTLSTDLTVYLKTAAGVVSTLTLDADYTVTGAGQATGGVVTLTTAANGTDSYTIQRDMPIQRETDFQARQSLAAPAINADLDAIVMRQQQIDRNVGQALRVHPSDGEFAELAEWSTLRGGYAYFKDQATPALEKLTTAAVVVSESSAIFETKAALSLVDITDTNLQFIITLGNTTIGDGGGAVYKRVTTEPTHDYKAQSQNGVHFEGQPDKDGFISATSFPGAGIGSQVNAAIAYINEVEPPDGNTWLADRTHIKIPGGNYTSDEMIDVEGMHALQIHGYGATIQNLTGSHTIMKFQNCPRSHVRGLQFDLRNNNNPDQAIWLAGQCSWMHFKDVSFQANSSNTDFACIRVQQGNSSGLEDDNRDLGNFQCMFENVWTRKLTGADPNNIAIGVDLQGATNGMNFFNCSFGSVETGIKISNQNSSTLSGIGNDIQIILTDFEGYTTAIEYVVDDNTKSVVGGAIIGCRAENGTDFLKLTGFAATPQQPVMLYGNTLIAPMTNYVNAGDDRWYNSLDQSNTPNNVTPRLGGYNGIFLASLGNTSASVRARSNSQANGGSLALERDDGTIDGRLSTRVGGGMDIDGGTPGIVRASGVNGLSGSQTHANNFRGFVTTATSTDTHSVSFTTDEPDVNYGVFVTGAQDRNYWIENKAVDGFDIKTGSNWTVADSLTWILVR